MATSRFTDLRAARAVATQRLKKWTRERFNLADDMTVFAGEVACASPGCPPIETVVIFWTAPGKRHAFKIFKGIGDTAESDLPPSWMKDALIDDGVADCC
jgi:nitrate reductase delta subunit